MEEITEESQAREFFMHGLSSIEQDWKGFPVILDIPDTNNNAKFERWERWAEGFYWNNILRSAKKQTENIIFVSSRGFIHL